MFRRMLVPLDGSGRAERAIPVAACLARTFGGSIVFLRVVTSPIEFAWEALESPMRMKEAFDAERASAADYLAHIAASDELSGVTTITDVLDGIPAQVILSAVSSQQADMMVMSSHGYTGFKRWALGSVAQKVVRSSPVPVLVLREGGAELPGGTRPVRILVALDGSSLAEAALAPAAYLSAALSPPAQGILHLVRVVPLPTRFEYGQNDRLAEARRLGMAEAKVYLQTVEQRLQAGDLASLKLRVTSSVLVDTDVAAGLIGTAENTQEMDEMGAFNDCDAIAMTTHGRSGLERWVLGSVAERVLGATRLPLLIARPPREATTPEKAGKATKPEAIEAGGWMGLL